MTGKSVSGDKGIRTLDPLLARQVLSQLSYTPMGIRQPPILPGRLQPSTVGRLSLNHRVRDVNGCSPQAHRHRKYKVILEPQGSEKTMRRMLAFESICF